MVFDRDSPKIYRNGIYLVQLSKLQELEKNVSEESFTTVSGNSAQLVISAMTSQAKMATLLGEPPQASETAPGTKRTAASFQIVLVLLCVSHVLVVYMLIYAHGL